MYTKWLVEMAEPGYYTERGRRFDSVVKYLAGGDMPLRLEGLALHSVKGLHRRDPGPAYARELARHADTRHISTTSIRDSASMRRRSIARSCASRPNRAPGHTRHILFSLNSPAGSECR